MSRWLTPVQAAMAAPQLALVLAGWLVVRLVPGLSRHCLPCPERSDYDSFEPAEPPEPRGRSLQVAAGNHGFESWQLN